uniref:Uncharacterized protein n=1 Tax=Plectus sambesii TaxID=2011161 RepID=A0A914VEA4_9BILA
MLSSVNNAELTNAYQPDGQIQALQYVDSHTKFSYQGECIRHQSDETSSFDRALHQYRPERRSTVPARRASRGSCVKRWWQDPGGGGSAGYSNEYRNNFTQSYGLAEPFDYSGQSVSVAVEFSVEWRAAQVNAMYNLPCVTKNSDGKALGKVDIRNERASSVYNGMCHVLFGLIVQS